MRECVVYYSMSGNSKKLAELIASERQIQLLELKPQHHYNVFLAFTKGVFDIKLKRNIGLTLNQDISSYQRVFLVCPVWAGEYPAFINSFIKHNDFNNKELYITGTTGSGPGNYLDLLHHATKTTNINSHSFIAKEFKQDPSHAIAWINSIKK